MCSGITRQFAMAAAADGGTGQARAAALGGVCCAAIGDTTAFGDRGTAAVSTRDLRVRFHEAAHAVELAHEQRSIETQVVRLIEGESAGVLSGHGSFVARARAF